MNVGTFLLSPIVRRRGWMLIYVLWQGVAIALLVASAAAEAPSASGPSGIYVNKKSTYDRIEFLPNGECFFHCASGAFPGSTAPEKDTFVCQRADEEKTLRFRFNGKVLVDLDGSDWVPREEVAKTPWNDLWPVTIVVLDSEDRNPLPCRCGVCRRTLPERENPRREDYRGQVFRRDGLVQPRRPVV